MRCNEEPVRIFRENASQERSSYRPALPYCYIINETYTFPFKERSLMTTRWSVIYNRAQNDDSQESFSVCSKACTFQFLRACFIRTAVMTLKVFMDFFLTVCLWLTLMSSLLYRCVNYTSAVLVPDVRNLYIKHFQSLMFPAHHHTLYLIQQLATH